MAGVPAFSGAELRWKREAAGRTLQETANGSFFGPSYLSEIERATRRMPQDLARHVDRVLETDGFFERRCEDVRKARRGAHAAYFAPIAEAETRARAIARWSNALIPGLLQTGAYARAVIHSTHPLDLPEEVEVKVRARLQRAKLFEAPKKLEYWVILHESLVRGPGPLLPPPGDGQNSSIRSPAWCGVGVSFHRSCRVMPRLVLSWNCRSCSWSLMTSRR